MVGTSKCVDHDERKANRVQGLPQAQRRDVAVLENPESFDQATC